MAPRESNSAAYKQARAELLRDAPLCHWCGIRPATELDHTVEQAQGGTIADGYVASCKPCNSKRGANYHARQQANVTQTRFLQTTAKTPSPLFSLSPANQPEPAAIVTDDGELVPTGRDQPRLETTRVGAESFGPAVAAWALEHIGVELMPWQVRCADGMLQTHTGTDGLPDPFGLCWSEALASTARQQGKSVLLSAIIGWWLTDFAALRSQPQHIMSVANRLDRAEAIFNNGLADALVERFGARAIYAVGRKKVMLNGSTWEVRAGTTNQHGGSYDLIVVDETWDVSAETIDTALRPSQIARRNSLMLHFSTAGDATSTAMIALRERALAEIDNNTPTDLYLCEWSMPPGCDGDLYWGYANPALGRTIDIGALRAASTRESFRRAHLNQWITARGAMLDAGVWESTVTDANLPTGGVLAIDSSLNESRYVGVRAAMHNDKVLIDMAFAVESEDDLWTEVNRLMAADKTITLAVTPTLEIHLPTELQRRHVVVGYAELLRYTALVKAMISERRVVHRASQLLTEHVNRAVAVKTAQGLVLSSQKSPGPIELARCAIWAAALVSRPVNRQRPMLVVS